MEYSGAIFGRRIYRKNDEFGNHGTFQMAAATIDLKKK